MSWATAAASVTGASHLKADLGCQDAHICETCADASGAPVLVLIAADGAGSAVHAAEGATLTCRSLREQIASWLSEGGSVEAIDRTLALDWVSGIREVIAEVAGERSASMRDFAANMLFAVIGGRHAAFGQIGDGAIVTSVVSGAWDRQFAPERGMYANETYFVTQDDASDHLQFTCCEKPISETAVFTDGLERLLLDTVQGVPHPPVFEKMFAPLRAEGTPGFSGKLSLALASYLSSAAVSVRTDDDVTLIIATRRS